jgi:large subunit ribosomal protein L32
MGPLPKRKFSWGRTHRRRAHDALTPVHLIDCDNCGEKKMPHVVCPSCGFYKGREVVSIKTDDKPKSKDGDKS